MHANFAFFVADVMGRFETVLPRGSRRETVLSGHSVARTGG